MTTKEEFESWISGSGSWVTTKMIKELPNKEAIAVIISDPQVVTRMFNDKEVTKLEMSIEINQKQYQLAITNRDAKEIAKEYGTDLTKWLGKGLKLTTIPTNLGDSIFAKPYYIQPLTTNPNTNTNTEPAKAGSGSPAHTNNTNPNTKKPQKPKTHFYLKKDYDYSFPIQKDLTGVIKK